MGKRFNNAKSHISKNKGKYGFGLFIFAIGILCLILWAAGVFTSSAKKQESKPSVKPNTANSANTITNHSTSSNFKPLYKKATDFNDDGGGNFIYFDRHQISCVDDKTKTMNGGLNRIHLNRNPDGNKIQFEYNCSDISSVFQFNDKDLKTNLSFLRGTDPNDSGGGNTIYLDRHDISCKDNEILTGLQLLKNDEGKIGYLYACVPSNKPLQSRELSTGMNDYGGGNSIYLDRHDIKCNDDEVLNELKLRRSDDGSQLEYKYKCVK